MSTADNLIRMAEQIAANLAAEGEAAAIEGTAQHIRMYWGPGMRSVLLRTDDGSVSRVVAAALHLLRH